MSNLTKEKQLASIIIDLVESAIRAEHQDIEFIVNPEFNTLLIGEVYYSLEDEITTLIKNIIGDIS